MNRSGSHHAESTTRAGRLALLAAMAMALSHAACTRDPAEGSGDTEQAAPVVTGATEPLAGAAAASQGALASVALPLRTGEAASLFPIHKGVDVRVDDQSVTVSYTRGRGQPFGAAYMLPGSDQPQRNHAGLLKDCTHVVLGIKTTPAIRPQLCLTDEAGNVWNAPLTKTQGDELTFDLSAVQPDPFQNGGRTLPAKPDLSNLRMITILDISGFMGAPEASCTWTISSIELHRDAPTNPAHAGGAR